MGKTTVRTDKMINTVVSITDAHEPPVVVSPSKKLLVDTGSPVTLVSWQNVQGGTFQLGPIVTFGGATGGSQSGVQLKGGKMTVETEQQGGGTPQNKDCPNMIAVIPDMDTGEGAHGLLGMDQLDSIGADPQKSANGATARLARRT